jgi:hypothetical protein
MTSQNIVRDCTALRSMFVRQIKQTRAEIAQYKEEQKVVCLIIVFATTMKFDMHHNCFLISWFLTGKNDIFWFCFQQAGIRRLQMAELRRQRQLEKQAQRDAVYLVW